MDWTSSSGAWRWGIDDIVSCIVEINTEQGTGIEYTVEGQSLNSSAGNKIVVNRCESGNEKKQVGGIASLGQATSNDLAFCSLNRERAMEQIAKSKAAIVLCSKDLKGTVHPRTGSLLVFVDNPRLVFVRYGNKVLRAKKSTIKRNDDAVAGSSSIAPTAIISKNNVRIEDD